MHDHYESPYIDMTCVLYIYICAYTPQSDFNIVYSCVHTLSHDYTTALTIYGYSLLYT